MSTLLDEEVFKGKEPIERSKIEEFRVKGLQELAGDLRRSTRHGMASLKWYVWR